MSINVYISSIKDINSVCFSFKSEVHLIKKDEKVGASEATLLQMLKIFPFSYGLQIQQGKL